MRTLSANTWRPPNRTTVDGARDAALDQVRQTYPHWPDHLDASEAVKNIDDGYPVMFGRVAQLVGHGAPGILATGCGKQGGQAGPGQLISLVRSDWQSELSRLRGRVVAVRLSGCRVGAGAEGLELLREVSCLVDAPVLGPTGALRVSSGKMWLQGGATWQIGQCGYKGTPLKPSEKTDWQSTWDDPDRGPTPPADHLGLALPGPLDIHFERPAMFGGGSTDWVGDEAEEVAAKAGLYESPLLDVGVLGLPTGALTIRTGDAQYTFELLGESVLQLIDSQITFEVSEEFLGLLPPYEITL